MMIDHERADYMARVFVNGLRDTQVPKGHEMHGKRIIDGSGWTALFLSHPLVKRAEIEGWAPNLRSHVIRVVRGRIMLGKPYNNLPDLMPDREVVDHWSRQAERFRLAAEWRAKICDEYGDVFTYLSRNKPRTGRRFQTVSTFLPRIA